MLSFKLKEKLKRLPSAPGVYIMKSRNGRILYIGKAKKLNNRVRSYFQVSNKDRKTLFLVSKIYDFEFYVTQNEVESLILEANLIQKERPPYNIRLKDDKQYPYLGFTNESYSALRVVRKKTFLFSEYFGPYTSVYPMRRTLDFINKNFKLRKCNKKLQYGKKVGKPCLYYQIGQCLGPCLGNVEVKEYEKNLQSVRSLLLGNYKELISKLKKDMKNFSKKLEFEKAAEKKHLLDYLQSTAEKQNITLEGAREVDAFYLGVYEETIHILVFFLRKEKISGRKSFFYENSFGQMSTELMSTFLNQFYSETDYLPDTILTSVLPENYNVLKKLLEEKFQKKIQLNLFDKMEATPLFELMKKNSQIMTEEHLLESLRENKEKGLYELKKILHLKKIPFRIEGFDISNTSGKQPVASMVSFKNGIPDKKEYRKFKIKTVEGINDFAMMEEVVARRYQRLINEKKELPDLILIDGGPQQLKFAKKSLDLLNVSIPLISLAKKEELIFKFDSAIPIKLDKSSKALQILQYVRDESHRFAITFHKKLRHKNFLSE